MFVSDEDNSLVQGIVTSEGLFDGTIFSKGEIYYVEPISRYTPSKHQHQISTSTPEKIHTIIYKTTDVKIPPSLNNTCASQILYLSRINSDFRVAKTKRSLGDVTSDHFQTKKHTVKFLDGNVVYDNPIANFKLNSAITRHKHRSTKNDVSSLPAVYSHDGLIKSNILKTHSNSHEENRTRKKVKDGFVFKYPTHLNDVKIIMSNNNMINRPKVSGNKSLSETRENFDRFQGFQETRDNGTLKHINKRATIDPKKTTCMLYLQADHLFYQKYGTEEACIEVMTRHVQRVNSIYKNTGNYRAEKCLPVEVT